MSRKARAQALTEFAIFGALVIIAFAFLINFSENINRQQSNMMQTFRKALKEARSAANQTSTYTKVEFKRMPNVASPMELGQLAQFSGSASVAWGNGTGFSEEVFNSTGAGDIVGYKNKPGTVKYQLNEDNPIEIDQMESLNNIIVDIVNETVTPDPGGGDDDSGASEYADILADLKDVIAIASNRGVNSDLLRTLVIAYSNIKAGKIDQEMIDGLTTAMYELYGYGSMADVDEDVQDTVDQLTEILDWCADHPCYEAWLCQESSTGWFCWYQTTAAGSCKVSTTCIDGDCVTITSAMTEPYGDVDAPFYFCYWVLSDGTCLDPYDWYNNACPCCSEQYVADYTAAKNMLTGDTRAAAYTLRDGVINPLKDVLAAGGGGEDEESPEGLTGYGWSIWELRNIEDALGELNPDYNATRTQLNQTIGNLSSLGLDGIDPDLLNRLRAFRDSLYGSTSGSVFQNTADTINIFRKTETPVAGIATYRSVNATDVLVSNITIDGKTYNFTHYLGPDGKYYNDTTQSVDRERWMK
jgi:hypothetical protein